MLLVKKNQSINLSIFRKKKEEELDLHVGDEVILIEERDDGWWRGEARGKQGWFPSYKVEAKGANR